MIEYLWYPNSMLARLLSQRHGFDCTVLFNLNANHEVDPTQKIRWEDKSVSHHIPGLECLSQADLVIFFTRLLSLPPEDLARIHTYLDSGNPIIGLRTANHGFLDFAYERKGRRVDFGDDVLGGAFRSHHGRWQQDSTRGILVDENREHPILRGVHDIWGTTDVYRTYPEGGVLPEGCTPLVMGQPLMGRQPGDPINPDLIALPVAWNRMGNVGCRTSRRSCVTRLAVNLRNALGIRPSIGLLRFSKEVRLETIPYPHDSSAIYYRSRLGCPRVADWMVGRRGTSR